MTRAAYPMRRFTLTRVPNRALSARNGEPS